MLAADSVEAAAALAVVTVAVVAAVVTVVSLGQPRNKFSKTFVDDGSLLVVEKIILCYETKIPKK